VFYSHFHFQCSSHWSSHLNMTSLSTRKKQDKISTSDTKHEKTVTKEKEEKEQEKESDEHDEEAQEESGEEEGQVHEDDGEGKGEDDADEKTEDTSVTATSSNNNNSNSNSNSITPDPNNHHIKHPLQYKWTWWYDAPSTKRSNVHSWEPCFKKITDFDTVEDFWCLFNNLVKTSELGDKANYQLMKSGIQPDWESSPNGGRWEIKLLKFDVLDTLWLHLILGVIGEEVEHSDQIRGCVCNIRQKGTRFEVWTEDYRRSEEIKSIGRKIKELLQISDRTIAYSSFPDLKKNQKRPLFEV